MFQKGIGVAIVTFIADEAATSPFWSIEFRICPHVAVTLLGRMIFAALVTEVIATAAIFVTVVLTPFTVTLSSRVKSRCHSMSRRTPANVCSAGK